MLNDLHKQHSFKKKDSGRSFGENSLPSIGEVDMNEERMKLQKSISRNLKKKKTMQNIRVLEERLAKIKTESQISSESQGKVKWSTQQKMYAMTENYFGLALFLIFRLFKTYENGVWVSIMLHSVVKIGYSMVKIFKNNSRFIQIVNGLVVGGEVCRYMLYLVMLLWSRESETEQILQDEKYGRWMIWLLIGELFFHLIGFLMTVVADCKTRVRKLKDWKARKAAKKRSKFNGENIAQEAKLFDTKKQGKKKGILNKYSNVGSIPDQGISLITLKRRTL